MNSSNNKMIKSIISCIIISFLMANLCNGINIKGDEQKQVNVMNSLPTFPYDQEIAESFVQYAYAAYCYGPDIQNWNCTTCKNIPGFNIISAIFNITTNTQAYVGYTNNQVIVSFRGSMDVDSWITNFKFLETIYPPYPQAKVHDGFYKGWASVSSQVKSSIDMALAKCGSNCQQIWVVGHSLGAALATLCVAEVQGWYTLPAYSYTYGSPRVGDSNFVEYFNQIHKNNYRVVNQHDLVPHVPMEGLLDYHHVPTEVYYPTNTTYIVCNDSGEDPICSDSVIGLSIYDHLHYFGIPCCCK
ncbi:hypothetical protein RB653_006940 [Dictyostelium firmibasis]|uniref:Fungal lipase-type domain-containing protein n=1 Tax=Dictyostelium firmibasis TaxID=79012 RepID=A0AAN7YNK4_9MYCE